MRNLFIITSTAIVLIILLMGYFWTPILLLLVVVLPFVGMGIQDMLQTKHAIRRNFPLLGRMRYIFEEMGAPIRQYFVETDLSGTPFTRLQRSIVYQRAKQELQTHPFGTELNVYAPDYEWMPHSIYPVPVMETPPRVQIGGDACTQPYSAALLNISAMSFGSLSKAAITALSMGAKKGGFYHNTGEGGVSPYHIEGGGDLTYQVGTGYFGCRSKDHNFDPDKFKVTAAHPNIKMIELKLSQGAKPGHGGILPAIKNTPEIAAIRGVEPHTTVNSPSYHKAFSDAEGLLRLLQQMRELSGGKPVGFKLCVGNKQEFKDICAAMVRTKLYPDFITVDGGEGGTGAAPLEFSNSVGMPLEDAIVFVHDTLRGYGLRQKIRIIASGKVVTAFDILKNLSLGADLCNSARGMMFALGCIQALQCHANTCPTGVATQDPELSKGLVPMDKSTRVANFQHDTIHSFMELIAAAGVSNTAQIHRGMVFQRVDTYTSKSFEEIYPSVAEGVFL
jgi:glutamate synthase domain-containing protein 2